MYWTLDILSDKDPSVKEDRTNHWEESIDEDSSPKLKFPLKLKEDPLNGETIEFKDPIIKEPPPKKKEMDKSLNLVEIGKSKNNKKNLF
jgi:hypothetical protein